jgi:predicted TIM-barrel fold metal-dependent hydrolase
MKACKNIFVESSNLIGQDNVSYFVKSLAADRILFGSFLPVNDPYASMGMILDADISRSDMEKVAGLNLKSLIHGAHL